VLGRVQHWKKQESIKNERRILDLLQKYGSLRFNELLTKLNEGAKKTKLSPSTLTNHLKDLEENRNVVEQYWDKEKKAPCYRIIPDEAEKVEGTKGKFDALSFIDEISNPLYAYKKKGGKMIAAFANRTGNKKVDDAMLKALQKQVSLNVNFLRGPTAGRKIAVVLMSGVEEEKEKE
jgi:DNA-binding Lrp family transcriptional regulator